MENLEYITKKILVSALATVSTAMCPLALHAQSMLEEVVVTAQKREQNLQDVGISVAAFTNQQMKALGWSSSENVAAQIPGLTTSKTAGGAISQFNIRGVGQADFQNHHEAPNAVYQDDVYVAAPGASGMPMFDLARVEVLRGPQGTLFGRNATGGLVHFVSSKPSHDTEATVILDVGEYSLFRTQGMINGSLNDNVAGRLALYQTNADGYIDNAIGDDLREENMFAGRGQLLISAGKDTEILLRAEGFSEDVDAGIYQPLPSFTDSNGVNQFVGPQENIYGVAGGDFYGYRDTDGDPLSVQADRVGKIVRDVYGFTADIDHDFGNQQLTAIANFGNVKTDYEEDTDSGPFDQTRYFADMDMDQYSLELQLNGENERLEWIAGAYYLNLDGDYGNSLALPTLAGFFDPDNFPGDGSGTGVGTGATGFGTWTLETEAWALFAQGEYQLTEQLSLTAGARWTDDTKDVVHEAACASEAIAPDGSTTCEFVGFSNVGDIIDQGVNFGPPVTDIDGAIVQSRGDADWSGKLQLDYRPSEDMLLYVSANKGLKGGGFTIAVDGLIAPGLMPYEPEQLFAYAVGGKYSFSKGYINFEGYAYDYKDFQTFEFRGLTSLVLNKDAQFYGAEVELGLNPQKGLDILLGAAYLDASTEDVVTPTGIEDQEPINAPEWQFNWLFRKVYSIGDSYEIALQYDGSYEGDRYFNTVNHPTTLAESYVKHNARISLMNQNGSWRVSLWGSNLGDEEYITHVFDVTILGYSIQKYGPPRWFGATFEYNF